KLGGGFRERVQHGSQVESRAADDLEHFRRRGLLLQRFAKLARALLLRLEQSHILDSDRRLVSKGLQKLDLWVREQPGLSASDRNRPDRKVVANYGDCNDAAIFADHRHRTEYVVGIRVGIRNLYETSFEYGACCRSPSAWRCGPRAPVHLEHLGGKTVVRHEVEELAVEPVHKAVLAIAEPPSALGDHVEHRLDVARRAADDLEHVGGSNLLLTRLIQFAGEPGHLCFRAGRVTRSYGHWRIAALRLCRLATLRFSWFAAYSGAPSHRPSLGLGLRRFSK